MTTLERQLEVEFISKLQEMKYAYRDDIRDKRALEQNFRQKFEELNRVKLTDSEFSRLMEDIITADVFEAATKLREINDFTRDDGTPLNYTLVNIKDWCKNTFEVINQLRINTDNSHHRYDVILLINGIPCVQIELKTLGINPRRAIEQIVEYKNDPGNGYTNSLLCYMQLFIASNRTETWYFANNNARHFKFDADERFLPVYQYADEDNKKIAHLEDFTEIFLAKCTLGRMISRYMVLVASEEMLLMMRPYQIYAVKAIVDCIDQNCGNGYIWHTTGSGKTLTSFKASTLLKDKEEIEKCLFVVDRKDLDRQTRLEFNKFQENCVEENTNTESLVRRLLSDDYADKVIVTTIQKLGLALDENSKRNKATKKKGKPTYNERLEPLRDKRMVFIFDECHRSQFGENHKSIKEFFPNSQLFGFTGTPIFAKNATKKKVENQEESFYTTVDLFQRQLHAYTITNAIEDKNVLRFHVDYFKPDGEEKPKKDQVLAKKAVIEAIISKHDQATANRRFNAVLATSSINDAIKYVEEFNEIQAQKQSEDEDYKPLKIACVFSPPAEGNQDVKQIQEDLPQEKADNEQDPEGKKKALNEIIAAYNAHYDTNHRISEFDQYYQDVQKRIKDQRFPNEDLDKKGEEKIDIIIVVDMLLTGFDSKYLNTLYVDKTLKHHGLIQAFSRTNRVLNSTKPYGNILDFRQQEKSVDTAIAMFSGSEGKKASEIWLVDDAGTVITSFEAAVNELNQFMESHGLEAAPEQVFNIPGDEAKAQIVNKIKEIQRLKTQLDQYTDLTQEHKEAIEEVMPEDDIRAFKGAYLSITQHLKEQRSEPGGDVPQEVDDVDFEFVLFASAMIDYDYIMSLITDYSNQTPGKEKMSREQLVGIIASDAKFMDERDEITEYIDTIEVGKGLDKDEIIGGYDAFKAEKHAKEVKNIATKHGLEQAPLQAFVTLILQRKIIDGDHLSDLFIPMELGWKERVDRELQLMNDLKPLLRKRAKGREISGLSAWDH